MLKISHTKKILFSVLFFTLCTMLLVLLELLLRLFHYGIDTRIFIQPKYVPDVFIDNPTFLDKYYSNGRLEQNNTYIKNIFKVSKPQNVLRGIIIGGSTAEGFPFRSNQSFGKIAEIALNQAQTDFNFEIINLGFTAMSSYYVKDAALKALNYQPDFMIIYAGHNEYYGTISHSTGGNYFIKNLYMSFKEFKLFQLLYNLFNKEPTISDNQLNLMARQFNNTRFLKNDKVDKQIADDFVKNIDSVVKACHEKNIPIIIFEPICNLIDMPPFSGAGDHSLADFIRNYNQAIKNKDAVQIQSFYNQAISNRTYMNNAQIIYLNAKADFIIYHEINIATFILAKDLDSTPFRARSKLINRFREYCLSHAEIYPIHYLPTFDVIANNLGIESLNNSLFIDHLHFNQYGQQVIGSILAQKIADLFHFSPNQKEKVQTFFMNNAHINQTIYLNAFNELWTYLLIQGLLDQPPYSLMLVPYEMPDYQKILVNNEILKTKMLKDFIDRNDVYSEVDIFDFIINYYLSNNQPNQAYQYLRSSYFQSPGSYKSSYDMAKFLSMLQNPPEDPMNFFLMAYLLSNKDDQIYNSMQTYLLQNNRQKELNEINLKYGKPKD